MKMRAIVALALTIVVTTACSSLAQSPQEKADLQDAIKSTDAEIADAKAQDAKYSGGLVKALIGSRLATLEQTKAMLQQRANAGAFSIAVRYTADGRPFIPPADGVAQASAIETELATIRIKIKAPHVSMAACGPDAVAGEGRGQTTDRLIFRSGAGEKG
jgi:hypothetical protein